MKNFAKFVKQRRALRKILKIKRLIFQEEQKIKEAEMMKNRHKFEIKMLEKELEDYKAVIGSERHLPTRCKFLWIPSGLPI